MNENELTAKIIGAAMRIHSALGPGLLESAYHACLVHELVKVGLNVASQVPLPICYDGSHLDAGYKLDIVVEDVVIVELNAVEKVLPIRKAQLLSYLKLSNRKLGLIINFHELHLRDGITRMKK